MQINVTQKEAMHCWVELDGNLVHRCLAADEEAGFVLVVALNERGYPMQNDYSGPVLRKLTGTVKILRGDL